MRIRIAQRAWAGSHPADTLDDTVIGLAMPWVELDGHRFDQISHAHIAIDSRGFPTITIGLIGLVEMVYLDSNGDVIGSVVTDPVTLDGTEFDGTSAVPVPEPTDVERLAEDRDDWRRRALEAEDTIGIMSRSRQP